MYLMSGEWIEIYMIIYFKMMNCISNKMSKTYIGLSPHLIKTAQTEIKI